MYNANEFGLYPSRASERIIGPGALLGKKKSKSRYTFLLCDYADGTKRLPRQVIGRAEEPRCFGGIPADFLGFSYTYNKTVWMTEILFR